VIYKNPQANFEVAREIIEPLLTEISRLTAEVWTNDDMRHAFRVGWNYNDHRSNYIRMQKEFDNWLAARRKGKEGA
jgi:hypothetical protein